MLLFVVYDPELRNVVLKNYLENKEEIKMIYDTVNNWISEIYKIGDLRIPAIFASKVFFNGETWDRSMQTRAVAAIFQLLVNSLEIPVWISWGDLELEDEIIRLIYVFSSASKVEGLKGRVIVCQFSDDDREIALDFNGETLKIKSLIGASSLFYTIFKEFGKGELGSKLEKANEKFKEIYDKTLENYKEISKRGQIVSLEEFEKLEEEGEEIKTKKMKSKQDLEELDLPTLEDVLKELDVNAEEEEL